MACCGRCLALPAKAAPARRAKSSRNPAIRLRSWKSGWIWISNGKVVEIATQEGGTLTFGDQMFTWEELDAAPGGYIVGFIVEDLDGNTYEVYEQVIVE